MKLFVDMHNKGNARVTPEDGYHKLSLTDLFEFTTQLQRPLRSKVVDLADAQFLGSSKGAWCYLVMNLTSCSNAHHLRHVRRLLLLPERGEGTGFGRGGEGMAVASEAEEQLWKRSMLMKEKALPGSLTRQLHFWRRTDSYLLMLRKKTAVEVPGFAAISALQLA